MSRSFKGSNASSRNAFWNLSNWRFENARKDGSGKMDTFNEVGSKRSGNTKLKRPASKDTRRINKRLTKEALESIIENDS